MHDSCTGVGGGTLGGWPATRGTTVGGWLAVGEGGTAGG